MLFNWKRNSLVFFTIFPHNNIFSSFSSSSSSSSSSSKQLLADCNQSDFFLTLILPIDLIIKTKRNQSALPKIVYISEFSFSDLNLTHPYLASLNAFYLLLVILLPTDVTTKSFVWELGVCVKMQLDST